MSFKPLERQVMVITGATSGIGLVTARKAAAQGARVVLVARNGEVLARVGDEIRDAGGECVEVVADVSKQADVEKIAGAAIQAFGGFDTWVNNAAVAIYGKLVDVPLEEQRQLFEVDFWGTVYGSFAAVAHLRNRGGVLINVGSVLSDRSIPLQGIYCAAKHAVKGFTDALRMEVEKDGLPIAISLIKPASIDTPYNEHAKNHLGEEPNNAPPVYAPDLVAGAILKCASHPRRDVFVGGAAKMLSAIGHRAPRLTDKIMEATMFRLQRKHELGQARVSNLFGPGEDGAERGHYRGRTRETSVYTKSVLNPVITVAVLAGTAAGLFAAFRAKSLF